MATKQFVDSTGLTQFAKEVKSFVQNYVSDNIPDGVVTETDIFDNSKIKVSLLPDFVLGQLLYGGLIMEGSIATAGRVSPSSNFSEKYGVGTASFEIGSSSSATYEGCYFIVQDFSSAGETYTNTTILGIENVSTGDWIVSNGSSWEKVDNTDAVTSVNGHTGAVEIKLSDLGYSHSDTAPTTGGSSTALLTTKGAVALYENAKSYTNSHVATKLGSYYTKTEIATELGKYYTKTEADNKFTPSQEVKSGDSKAVSGGAVYAFVTEKGYQTSAQVESAITSKGYQTAAGVKTTVSSTFTVNGDAPSSNNFAISSLSASDITTLFNNA